VSKGTDLKKVWQAAAVQARKQEVIVGKVIVEKTKAARDDYFRRVHQELGIKSAVVGRKGP
jgi:hypothetical protein